MGMSLFELCFTGERGDLGSILSLEPDILTEFLRVMEGNGSSMDFFSLLSENELPLVDLRLARPPSLTDYSCWDFLMLSLGKKDLGSSSYLKDFFLVCWDNNKGT
jgi:hypothetical protein